ncbi:hypothetical protein FACS1894174_02400 [Bacteroidia bacterium]|nr:hypothetical protein FACS1894174_02400 [Bacteroidia bacterium]
MNVINKDEAWKILYNRLEQGNLIPEVSEIILSISYTVPLDLGKLIALFRTGSSGTIADRQNGKRQNMQNRMRFIPLGRLRFIDVNSVGFFCI